jgi:multidrug efflux pump subunit AcrB
MAEEKPAAARGTAGLIGVFARHPTAANLLMALVVICGLVALSRLNTQFFPNFGIDIVRVEIEWPGASAEDVDLNVVEAIEPEVRFLDGVKEVRASSREGYATIAIEFLPGADMQAALADVETAVGQVTTLPEDAEEPEVRRVVRYEPVTRIVLSGPFSERALKAVAKQMRDDLLDRGLDKVDLIGVRDEEIWVDVFPETLLRLDLTLNDIARAIAATSVDLPSGDTGGAAERQIRSLGLQRDADGIGGIEVLALGGGEKVLVRDVAHVRQAFEDEGMTLLRDRQPAVELFVQRALDADALELAATVDDYVAEVAPTLPEGLKLEQYETMAEVIEGRIDLLLRNGLGGLVLVLIVLFVFLNGRVALWVAVGIPVALLATAIIMLLTGQTLNMVSLFGLIMVLGIIVDDAIVVGEHAETRFREGLAPVDAATAGAQRMAAPVLCASITTVAAFAPLFLISDILGEIIREIPLTVCIAIIASLVECFLILPGHLRGAFQHERARASRFRRGFERGFERVRDRALEPALRACLRHRLMTLATALSALILALGLVAGGRIGFNFFPAPEAERIYLNLQMVDGTPRAVTEAVLADLDRALLRAAGRLNGNGAAGQPNGKDAGAGGGGESGGDGPIEIRLTHLGGAVSRNPGAFTGAGDHVGGIAVELAPSERREIRTQSLIDAWRAEIDEPPGVETLTILPATSGPPGRDLDVRISGTELTRMRAAADEVRALLGRYPGVGEIEDDLPFGKEETILEVSPRGRALGLTTETLGRQVRNAFQGAIAKRFPLGDEEVTVRVQLDRGRLGERALDTLYVRGPGGAEVAIADVVDTRAKQGFARVTREDGRRQVAVTAEVDSRTTTAADVIDAMWRDGLADIGRRHDVRFYFAGKAEEQAQTFADMRIGALVALVAIYVVLAWVFASYTRPLTVMSVIPLSFIGASLGHYLLGFDLTILSMVALLGLSGIVVNDSIILVNTIGDYARRGGDLVEAVVAGVRARFRAIVLTSLTTIGGLLPLIFEKSLQAQFLVPMAVTIVFGLMGTTFLVLLVVPTLIVTEERVRARLSRRRARAPQSGKGTGDEADPTAAG